MTSETLPIPYGWFAVGYSEELVNGDVRPLKYFGTDLVLFRTEGGEVRLLDAFCPHQGAHLGHGGAVHGESIACPFHGWEFDGAGMCTAVPYAKQIPPRVKDKPCIRSYPLIERNRVIWAWYHPRALEPAFEVDEMEPLSEPGWIYQHEYEWEIGSPIQETGENGVDIAHFPYVHSSQDMPRATVDLSEHRRITNMYSRTHYIDDDGVVDLSGERWEDTHLVTTNCGPGMTYQHFDRLFQLFMLGTVTPIDARRTHMRWLFAMPGQQTETEKLYAQGLIVELARQVEQDIIIWDNKRYVPDPVLCDGDGPIAKYRRWFSQFYDTGSDDSPVRLVK